MCRVLGLSPSGYYAWVRRPPSARVKRDAELVLKIRKTYDEYRQVYGRPRLYAELKEAGGYRGRSRIQEPSVSHSLPRFGCLLGTLSPSCLQIRSTRLWFTAQPSVLIIPVTIRYP